MSAAGIDIVTGDARDIELELLDTDVLVIDPPYDLPDLVRWSATLGVARGRRIPLSTLVLTDPRHVGEVTALYGPPAWLFVWDTASPWNTSPRRPLQQCKLAAYYGDIDQYDRDGALYGDPPPARDHPTTKSEPLDGRRLTDVYRESLRWLHHPGPGQSGNLDGTARFAVRAGDRELRHAKPVDWLKCLIGNTGAAAPAGRVVDPFTGSGSALIAAARLGRPAIGIEVDPDIAEYARRRLAVELDPPARLPSPTLTLFD